MSARGCLRLLNISNNCAVHQNSSLLRKCCVLLQSRCKSADASAFSLSKSPIDISKVNSQDQAHPRCIGIYSDRKADKCWPTLDGPGVLQQLSNNHLPSKRSFCTRVLQEALETDDDDIADSQGSFDKHGISQHIQNKLRAAGINVLFPVQYETFQRTIQGKDVIVQARTGTGKTLSFALPLVQLLEESFSARVGRRPKVIVLAPTRELACQVKADFDQLSDRLSVCAIYGGTAYEPQDQTLRSGVDVVVGTPGRINDLIEKGSLSLSDIQHVVLDEVDRMLDMGFSDIVEQIIRNCYTKDITPQTLLYSATMPPWVKQTARKYLKDDYETVNLVGDQKMKTSTTVEQLAIKCHYMERPSLISDIVKVYAGQHGRAIVFCRTKKEADQLCTGSLSRGSAVLHGDVPQAKREMVIKAFKEGKIKVLLTTDVAARGLDIPDVNVVIQTQPPEDLDSFVHRTGRTGRAGKSGVAICFYQPSEKEQLKLCEKSAKIKFRHIHSPNPEDIIKASARDAARSLDGVPEETINYFRESAEMMIHERGAVQSLAAAMAVITGATKIATRSLLSNREGYTTYIYKTDVEMRGLGLVRSVVRRLLGTEADVKNFTFTEDKSAVVFDVNSEHAVDMELFVPRPGESLERAKTLPALSQWSSSNADQGYAGNRDQGHRRGAGSYGKQSYNKGSDHRPWQSRERRYDRTNKYSSNQFYGGSEEYDLEEEEELYKKFNQYQGNGRDSQYMGSDYPRGRERSYVHGGRPLKIQRAQSDGRTAEGRTSRYWNPNGQQSE